MGKRRECVLDATTVRPSSPFVSHPGREPVLRNEGANSHRRTPSPYPHCIDLLILGALTYASFSRRGLRHEKDALRTVLCACLPAELERNLGVWDLPVEGPPSTRVCLRILLSAPFQRPP